jgi:hypothetical protein
LNQNCNPDNLNGEEGYILTTFLSLIGFIENINENSGELN